MASDICTVKTFTYKINRGNLSRKIFYDIEIPLPEFVEPEDLFGHLLAKENVPIPFHDDIKKAFCKFIVLESQKFLDSIAEAKVTKALAQKETGAFDGILELASHFTHEKSEISKSMSHSSVPPFDERFQAVIKKSSPAQLSRIVGAEAEMSEQMSSLVRARDFEMERLSKACESTMNTVEDGHNIEQKSYNLAMLNEKLRQISTNYFNQIDALSESQRRSYKELIDQLFYNTKEEDVVEKDIVKVPKKSQPNGISNIRKSISCDSQLTRSTKNTTCSRDESFTIYIGAQMKSMHNARILLCDRLSDLCQAPSSSELNCGNVDLNSRRLQMLMSLYRRDLTSVVLLVGRDPFYHIQNRTHFAKLCEQSAELHFGSLEAQLKHVEVEVRKCNLERQQSQSKNSPSAYDNADHFMYDETVLQPGDVYITCHSNLSSAQVVYHLVVNKQLQTEDISSRHACIGGLRNIIRLSSKCAVQSISLPLLLVEMMNESMTVSWCMSRAELIFKCIKGFLMEVSAGSCSSATASSPSSTVHYNINFVLPSKISPVLFNQIVELFSTIFHLVPSVSA